MSLQVFVECGRSSVEVKLWGSDYPPLFRLPRSEEVCRAAASLQGGRLLLFLLLASRLPPQRALELAERAPEELARLLLSYISLPRGRGATLLGRRKARLARIVQELAEMR